MKRLLTAIVLLIVLAALPAISVHAQEQPEQPKVFQAVFNKSFPTVWKSIKKSLSETGCLIEHEKYAESDEGVYKGKLTSVFCVIATGLDTTEPVMERYAKRIPYIRGATWTSLRMQYLFYVTENADNSVEVKLKGEISGYESYITNIFHYFESNGILEDAMMERLKNNVAASNDDE